MSGKILKMGPKADIAVSILVFAIFLLMLYTFHYNGLMRPILAIIDQLVPLGGTMLEAVFVLFVLAVIILDPGSEPKLRTILYVSWALYLPTALYFSRIDILAAMGSPLSFGVLASGLPAFIVILAGLALACGELALRSLGSIQGARANFLERGADPGEVNAALDKNMGFEARMIAISACIVLAIILVVPVAEPLALGIVRSTEYAYMIAGIGAAALLIVTIIAYLWPSKNSEKR